MREVRILANARDFRFLVPGPRLNAFSEISAMWGRGGLVRRADFDEFETQELILRELAAEPQRA